MFLLLFPGLVLLPRSYIKMGLRILLPLVLLALAASTCGELHSLGCDAAAVVVTHTLAAV